jgi:hypothetical protein
MGQFVFSGIYLTPMFSRTFQKFANATLLLNLEGFTHVYENRLVLFLLVTLSPGFASPSKVRHRHAQPPPSTRVLVDIAHTPKGHVLTRLTTPYI